MEAARFPMLSLKPKSVTTKTKFKDVLLPLIVAHFDEEASKYTAECSELDDLRLSACNAPLDYNGCATLKKYYCQLCFLLRRFPFLVGHQDLDLKFSWKDAYSGKTVCLNDIEFEKAVILYNTAAIHSFLGSVETRNSAEGMKVSCTHFQNAAWAFQTVRDEFSSDYFSDWTFDILSFLQQLMLAQAQECILEKSMADNRKSHITAKVAAQCSEFYKTALKHLNGSSASGVFGSSQFQKWKKHIELKESFTLCVTYYYMTLHSENQDLYGERLAYAEAASAKLSECIKLSQGMSDEVTASMQFVSDVVNGKAIAARKDDDFVYHAKVPSFDSLPEIKGAVLVKGLGFEVSDKNISGRDIFSKLVPIEAHEVASLYSEEKAKLLRRIGDSVHQMDETLEQYSASLQLDPSALMLDSDVIPDLLVEKCAAIAVKPGAVEGMSSAMEALSAISTSTLAELDKAESVLQSETDAENEFQSEHGKRKVNSSATEMGAELQKWKQAFTKASENNSELQRAMQLHLQNLRVLASPLSEVKSALPNAWSALTDEELAVKTRIEQLFAKINEVKVQRTNLYTKLRDQVMTDDITKDVVTSGSANPQSLFAEQLKKHDPLVEQIEMYLNAQPKVLDALTKANVEFVVIKQKIDLVEQQREAKIQSLVYSYDVYEDLIDKQKKGMEFYIKLQKNVQSLLERIQDFHQVQEKERATIVEKSKSKVPPRPSVPYKHSEANASGTGIKSSARPRLKDYLPFMKDGNTAATAISSVAGDESDDVNDQLNIEEFSEDSISDTPKLKDFLPFMNKQQKLKPDRSLIPPEALKYMPSNAGSSVPSSNMGQFSFNSSANHVTGLDSHMNPANPMSHQSRFSHTSGPSQPRMFTQPNIRFPHQNLPFLSPMSKPQQLRQPPHQLHQPPQPRHFHQQPQQLQQPQQPQQLQQPQQQQPQQSPQLQQPPQQLQQPPQQLQQPQRPQQQQPQQSQQLQHPQQPQQLQQQQQPQQLQQPQRPQQQQPQQLQQPQQPQQLQQPPQQLQQPSESSLAVNSQYSQQTPMFHDTQYSQAINFSNQPTAVSQQPIASMSHQPSFSRQPQPSQTVATPFPHQQHVSHMALPSLQDQNSQLPAQLPFPLQQFSGVMQQNLASQGIPGSPSLPQNLIKQLPGNQPQLPTQQFSGMQPQLTTQQPFESQPQVSTQNSFVIQQQLLPPKPFGIRPQVPLQQPFGSQPQGSTQPFGTQPQRSTQQLSGAQPQGSTQQSFGTQPQGSTQPPSGTQPQGFTQQPFGTQPQRPTQQPSGTQPQGFTQQPFVTQPQRSTQQLSGTQPQGSTQQSFGTQPQGSTQPPSGTQPQGFTQQPFGTQPQGSTQQPSGAQPQGFTQQSLGTQPQGSIQQSFGSQLQGSTQQPFRSQPQGPAQQPSGSLSQTSSQSFRSQPQTSTLPFGSQPQVSTQQTFRNQSQFPTQSFGNQPQLPISYNKNNLSTHYSNSSQVSANPLNMTPQSPFVSAALPNPQQTPPSKDANCQSQTLQGAGNSQANVHLLHAARQKGINNFTSTSQPPFHAGPQQTAQFPSQTEKPAFSVANTATYSDSPQGAVDLLGNQDCDNASAVLQPVSITSHTPIMSSNVALSVPSSTPSSRVATPLLSSGGSSSGGHQHAADSQSHQLQRQQPTEADHATSADQQNYVVPDYSRQNLIPDSSYQQSSFDTLPSTAAPATQPKMVNVHMRGGTKSWLPSQTSSTSPNYHSIPIVAVSPQQKTSSAAEQTSNALPTSNLKTVDLHTSKTSLDWSLTTAKPPSNPLAGETQSSSPRASGSRENASRSKPSIVRLPSRDNRQPYSDEDSLQQFVATVERYVKQLDTLTKPSLKGPTPLDTEWQDMLNEQEVESKRSSTAVGLSEPSRNRFRDILPYDKYRVKLTSQKNDYINASLLKDMFEGCPKFIATQGPLNQTEADFWNMIIEQKVEYIVMLSRWSEQDSSETVRYWPRDRNDRLSFGNLLITLVLTNNHKCWIERKLNMTNLVTKATHVCTQLQFTAWPAEGLPEPMPLLTLINEVTSVYKKQSSSHTPIVVHCGNGISKTGIFCTLYYGINFVNTGQGIFKVGHAVDLLRQRRKGMVSTKEGYLFCHTALLYYAQDMLVKRGILTSQTTFSNPLTDLSHKRTPSNDFILSDTSMASLDQLSTLSFSSASPASREKSISEGMTKSEKERSKETAKVTDSKDSHAVTDSPPVFTHSANLHTINSNLTPTQVDTKDSNVSQSEGSEKILSASDQTNETVSTASGQGDKDLGGILSLADPQKFDIGKGRQRITKADFFNPTSGIATSSKTEGDPFGALDPLWSHGK